MRRQISLPPFPWFLVLFSIAPIRATAAQTSPVLTRAATSITPADVRRRINIIADDSMLGRDTPSRGLELTAAYVADQFRKFGLKPAGDSGRFIQRYQINRTELDVSGSRIRLTANGRETQLDLTRDARLSFGANCTPAPPSVSGTAAAAYASTGTDRKSVV